MVKREHPEIDLAAGEVDGEPVVQRRRSQVEPDHLLCPITRDMFRDPVILIESGHTYEKVAIEHHLRYRRTDPRTNVRVQSIALSTNMAIRMAVDAWLADNPGVTPDGWDSRELLAPSLRQHRPTLHTCAEKGHLDVARDLIEAGADVNAKDNEGLTPLYMCALGGHVEVARALIEAGADVNAKKDNGVTPLHMCAYTGHLEVSRALIEKGADVNTKEDDGVTPLYVCSQEGHLEGHLEVARALIKAGSNFNGLSSEQVANLCRRLI
jgi:ankyrin repeat protein